MRKAAFLICLLLALSLPSFGTQAQDRTTLTLITWRADETTAWNAILSDFQNQNPNISLQIVTNTPEHYDDQLASQLKAGTAADLIACRPFDVAANLYNAKYLTPLTDLPGLDNFGDFARHPWTSNGTTYCLPISSALHGFLYNKSYFDDHGLKEPKTWEDFIALLRQLANLKDVIPLAIGTNDNAYLANRVFNLAGPNFWDGELGRINLISGDQTYISTPFIDAFTAVGQLAPYLPVSRSSLTPNDALDLFLSQKAVIYPITSSEIPLIQQATFKTAIFRAPQPANSDTTCWLEDEPLYGIGINTATTHQVAARNLLEYLASPKFATLYSQLLPGTFSLNATAISTIRQNPGRLNPLAARLLAFKNVCQSTLPSEIEYLNSNPTRSTTADLGQAIAALLDGKLTAYQAAAQVQTGLTSWYTPHK